MTKLIDIINCYNVIIKLLAEKLVKSTLNGLTYSGIHILNDLISILGLHYCNLNDLICHQMNLNMSEAFVL